MEHNYNITVKPDSGTPEEARQYAREMVRAMKAHIVETLHNEMRPGGALNQNLRYHK
jgi:hypothetical protein